MKTSDIPEGEILEACRQFHATLGQTPDEALAHKYPPKVILSKMRKMVDKGLLDYGVSLRTAWVKGDYSNRPKHEPGSLCDLAEKTAERLWAEGYIHGISMQDTRVRAVYRIILAKLQDGPTSSMNQRAESKAHYRASVERES